MPNFIDRRLNPKDKSLGNRQRFLRRARAQIKEVVNQSLKDRSISDVDGGQTIDELTHRATLPPRCGWIGTSKR